MSSSSSTSSISSTPSSMKSSPPTPSSHTRRDRGHRHPADTPHRDHSPAAARHGGEDDNEGVDSSRDALTMLHRLERLLHRASVEAVSPSQQRRSSSSSTSSSSSSSNVHRGTRHNASTSRAAAPCQPLTPPRTREVLDATEEAYYTDPNISANEQSIVSNNQNPHAQGAQYSHEVSNDYFANRPASHSRYLYLLPETKSTANRSSAAGSRGDREPRMRSPLRSQVVGGSTHPSARVVGNMGVSTIPHYSPPQPRNYQSSSRGPTATSSSKRHTGGAVGPAPLSSTQRPNSATTQGVQSRVLSPTRRGTSGPDPSPYRPFAVPSMLKDMERRAVHQINTSASHTATTASRSHLRATSSVTLGKSNGGGAPHLTTSQRDLVAYQARELEELRHAVLSYSDLLHESKNNYTVKEKEVMLLTKQRDGALRDVERLGHKYTTLQSHHAEEAKLVESELTSLKEKLAKQKAKLEKKEDDALADRIAGQEARGNARSLEDQLSGAKRELELMTKERDALAISATKKDKVILDQRRQLEALRKVLMSLKDFAPSRELRQAVATAATYNGGSGSAGSVDGGADAKTPPREERGKNRRTAAGGDSTPPIPDYNHFDPPYPANQSPARPCSH